jgi:hypothetical protein
LRTGKPLPAPGNHAAIMAAEFGSYDGLAEEIIVDQIGELAYGWNDAGHAVPFAGMPATGALDAVGAAVGVPVVPLPVAVAPGDGLANGVGENATYVAVTFGGATVPHTSK